MAKVKTSGTFAGRLNGQNMGGCTVSGGGLLGGMAIRLRTSGLLGTVTRQRGQDEAARYRRSRGCVASDVNRAIGKDWQKVELLGHPGRLAFTQDATGLTVKLPSEKPCDFAYALKITGLNLLKSESQG